MRARAAVTRVYLALARVTVVATRVTSDRCDILGLKLHLYLSPDLEPKKDPSLY